MVSPLYKRFGQVLAAQFPGAAQGTLRPGASEAAIAEAERAIGLCFPAAVREAYRHFDGVCTPQQRHFDLQAPIPPLFPGQADWLPLEALVSQWQLLREVEAGLRAKGCLSELSLEDRHPPRPVVAASFEAERLPIAANICGCTIEVDLMPGRTGQMGQLLYQDPQDEPRLFCSGLEDYFERLLAALESGRLVAREGGWHDADSGAPSWSLRYALGLGPRERSAAELVAEHRAATQAATQAEPVPHRLSGWTPWTVAPASPAEPPRTRDGFRRHQRPSRSRR
ncbi:SMI1/KNR4 family protein [Inhella proteolytica]|uniref:SMI1/KNR4 family protein n=1 Tax=Inhella proteolytica TaxID=2795029 RepID=A0A931J379_9BURK|nr:SMI1/KNR4 family protein [Inhella proteolytica]MBH9575370.1 SMI1/KNR4 family protein [Inhella proteolytica]